MLPNREYTIFHDFQAAMVNGRSWNLILDQMIVATYHFLKLILLLTKLPNYDEMDCVSMWMKYTLCKGLDIKQIYQYFHIVKNTSGNYLVKFEDMFDT